MCSLIQAVYRLKILIKLGLILAWIKSVYNQPSFSTLTIINSEQSSLLELPSATFEPSIIINHFCTIKFVMTPDSLHRRLNAASLSWPMMHWRWFFTCQCQNLILPWQLFVEQLQHLRKWMAWCLHLFSKVHLCAWSFYGFLFSRGQWTRQTYRRKMAHDHQVKIG